MEENKILVNHVAYKQANNLFLKLSDESFASIHQRYEDLGKQLVKYRKQYIQLQDKYPPESEYLIAQMNKLASLLEVIKLEILELHERLKNYQKQPKKVSTIKRFMSHVS